MMRAWLLLTALLALPMYAAEGPAGPDLKAAGQAFVKQLADGQFEAAESAFDDVMKTAMPTDKLEAAWQQIQANAGAFQEQTAVRQESQGNLSIVLVTCRFEKTTLEAKVVYGTDGRISGLWFGPPRQYGPPPYADRSAFTEQDVTVGKGEWALPGTLSLPNGDGPFPALVLVHGSGPQDRDETIGANKPFRDLAWGLASRGVAVLRYEKRTKEYAQQMAADVAHVTVKEETIDDAAAAVALLRATKGVDPERVFVLGHSLGGMLVPRMATAAPQAAGFVIMAGTTRPLEDVVLDQLDYIASLAGRELTAQEKQQLDALREQAQEVKALKPEDADGTKTVLGAPAAYWLDLRGYHPAEAARAISRPLLILQGGRDYQVTVADYDGWKKALDGRPNVTFKLYPALNHLFIAGEGQSTPNQDQQAGHVDEQVVADIAAWVAAH